MLGILVGLILGAVVGSISGVIIIIKRKTLAYEVWIPLLALSVFATIVCAYAALCLSSVFAIEALY